MVRRFLSVIDRTVLNRSDIQLFRRLFHRHSVIMQDTRPPGHRQRRLDNLKLMNFTMSVNEDRVEATVHTNGLSYADYDSRNAKPKPWHLMKFLESARYFAHHWPLDDSGKIFRDYAKLTDDRMTFLVTSVLDIKREMYNSKVLKSPLDVIVKGGFIGNSSLNSITSVITSAGIELMSNVNQVVSIDKSSRRPLPLPDWWKQKYAESAKSCPPLKFSKIEKPENIPFYDYKVARSDLDGNNHANWSVYVKFALDAMYHFSKTGYLASMPNFDEFSVNRMELMYSGESFDDDVLKVYAWEDHSSPFTAIVHIYKEDSFLFQGRFLFFDDGKA